MVCFYISCEEQVLAGTRSPHIIMEVRRMTPSTHQEYLAHVSTHCLIKADDPLFWQSLGTYHEEVSILLGLSLNPVSEALAALYCPTGQGDPTDPSAMLRSWLLMTLCREGSPTAWAVRLKREPVLAILAGFTPGQTPCATSHRNFLSRVLDGPYAVRARQDVTASQQLAGRHRHRLDDATKARRAAAEAAGKRQSELLAETLLAQADQPRNPQELQTRLEHLFVELGLKPTLATSLLPDELTVAGDGTAEPSAASGDGYRACHCPPGSRCDCARDYLSKTAQWCYDVRHGYTFGDRSYTISVHVKGHDIPLMTILPGGNESDFTLSLKALDRLLKLLEELDTAPGIRIFIGDGHHDAMGIYRYLKEKGISPIIPLDDDSQPAPPPTNAEAEATPAEADTMDATAEGQATTPPPQKPITPRPQVEQYPDITFEPDGTPLCPGGCRMRHQGYLTGRAAHIFACPCTRKNGKQEWVFHADECPFHEDCTPPAKKMGYTRYIKSEADLRLFPPIPRDSKRFKELYAHRSGTERQNSVADSYNVDGRHRNAADTLIRLTFVNICKHARIRQKEGGKTTPQARLHAALTQLGLSSILPN
jgi:hypothetical protein